MSLHQLSVRKSISDMSQAYPFVEVAEPLQSLVRDLLFTKKRRLARIPYPVPEPISRLAPWQTPKQLKINIQVK